MLCIAQNFRKKGLSTCDIDQLSDVKMFDNRLTLFETINRRHIKFKGDKRNRGLICHMYILFYSRFFHDNRKTSAHVFYFFRFTRIIFHRFYTYNHLVK